MTVYVDSSFLLSLYVVDAHSVEVDRRMASLPAVQITPFNRAEVAVALHQQVFLQRMKLVDAMQSWRDFEGDCRSGLLTTVGFPELAWVRTVDLARRHGAIFGVRALDSLHVACALELAAERFWTFDERQQRLAQAVGLDTNP